MHRNDYKPDDLVPDHVKTFWVHHYRHRLSHAAQTILERFPPCAQCGERVRFEAANITPPRAAFLQTDPDFRRASASVPLKLRRAG